MGMHFKPADGYVGDVIPFYWNGEYHAFYLKRMEGRGLPWAHAFSTDLVHWKELPMAIDLGGPEDPDAEGCWTGCVTESEGVFHMFYTGSNSGRGSYPPQTVCHATSPDLIRWEKDPANPVVLPDPRWYERGDWRDPFVFWNEEEKCYWMLIAARVRQGPTPRRGCVAVAKSPDLKRWEVHQPLWTPYHVYVPECPDLFRSGRRWYLVFSTVETRYRVSEDLHGPWRSFPVESFDSLRFYAAKTLSDGRRRLLLGWIPSQEGGRDEGKWEWGGHMGLPREVVTRPGGSLAVRCPREIVNAFGKTVVEPGSTRYEVGTGSWSAEDEKLVGTAYDGFGFVSFPQTPDDYFLETKVTLDSLAASAGFLLRASGNLDTGYVVALEPGAHRVLFRYWQTWGDNPPSVERPLDIQPNKPVACRIFVQKSILEAFFDDEIIMSTRIYNYATGRLCLFVKDGQAVFEGLRSATR